MVHTAKVGVGTESDATTRAIRASRAEWLSNLQTLLADAKRHFADVAWRVDGDEEGAMIYGRKGTVALAKCQSAS